jgi:hypothetical protein
MPLLKPRSSLALALGVVLVPGLAAAEPGGCLKYGAAGAVAGHVAHHHGVLGAAGGCATGMYVRHRYRKQQRANARDAAAYRDEHAGQDAGVPPDASR